MDLPTECKALETALRDAGGNLNNTLALVPLNRSTWTRYKNGDLGTGYTAAIGRRMETVRAVFAKATDNATLQRAAELAAAAQ